MAKTAKIIDGKKIAATIRGELKQQVDLLAGRGVVPGLAVVLVGDNPASRVYVRMKKKACDELAINSFDHNLPKNCSQNRLLKLIDKLNADPDVDGILVQLPLPDKIDERVVLLAIDPAKDVDGFHPVNMGRLLAGDPAFMPCTPYGCQVMLHRAGYDPAGKHVVIVGRSNIVG